MSIFSMASIYIWTASQSQIVGGNKADTRPDGHLRLNKDDAQNLSNVILSGRNQ